MRPDPPFYVGTTRPGKVGWTRVAITLVVGVLVGYVVASRVQPFDMAMMVVIVAIFVLLAGWTLCLQWTRFVVDERGLTVSMGGFAPRRPWPLENFRTVQLREIPSSMVGVTVGGYGLRRTRTASARPEELRPVGARKIFTTGQAQQPYRTLVTRPGTMVEIIGRDGTSYLISPVDVGATAAAVDQAIRARR